MIPLLQQLSPRALMILFGVIQIGLVVVMAWIVQWKLNKSPRQQHFVWLAALLAVALSAPLQFTLPSLQFEVASFQQESVPPRAARAQAKPNRLPPVESTEKVIGESPEVSNLPVVASVESSSPTPVVLNSPVEKSGSSFLVMAKNWVSKLDWKLVGIVAYLAVAIVFLLRLMIGWVFLRFISGTEFSDERLDGLSHELGLRHSPKVLLTDKVKMPLAFGIVKPTVLLPSEFSQWTEQCQNVVLTHELCHIKRRDAIWDLLARCLVAVYWFHPAVHFAGRNLRRSREDATDATVLEHGISPAVYARELLTVASGSQFARSIPALAMADSHGFSDRIKRILAAEPATGGMRFVPRSAFQFLVVACFICLAGFSIQFSVAQQPASVPDQNSEQEEKTFDPKTVTGNTFYERVNKTPSMKPTKRNDVLVLNVFGTVRDSKKNPAAGAIVILRNGHAMSSNSANVINDVYAKTQADANGNYKFEDVKITREYAQPEVFAFASSGELGWLSLHPVKDGLQKRFDVDLLETVTLKGRVVDEEGLPVSNVVLDLQTFRRESGHRQDNYVGFTDRLISPSTTTRADGEFEFPALPATFAVSLYARHPDFAHKYISIRTSEKHPAWLAHPTTNEKVPINSNGDSLTLAKGVPVKLKVVDAQSNPIAGVAVKMFRRMAKTNANGVFQANFPKQYFAEEETSCRVGHKEYGYHSFKLPTAKLLAGSAVATLLDPARITGKVLVKGSNAPVPDVSVHVSSTGGSSFVIQTDVDGVFEHPAVAPGDVTLKIAGRVAGLNLLEDDRLVKPGLHQNFMRYFELKPGETKELETILVETIRPIPILVVNEEKKPMAGVKVCLYSPADYGSLVENSQWITTEMDGRAELFPFTIVGDGSVFEARFNSGESVFLGEARIEPDGKTSELVLLPATQVRGKVTVNGEPVVGVGLRVSKDGDKSDVTFSVNGKQVRGTYSRDAGAVVTDENGEYVLLVMKNTFNGKAARYFVGIESGVPNEEFLSGRQMAAKFENDRHVQDFNLVKGDSEIRGVVVDADGIPVSDCKVLIQRKNRERGKIAPVNPADLYEPAYALTNENGEFVIWGLPVDSEFRIRTSPSDRDFGSGQFEHSDYVANAEAKAGGTDLKLQIPLKQRGKKKD